MASVSFVKSKFQLGTDTLQFNYDINGTQGTSGPSPYPTVDISPAMNVSIGLSANGSSTAEVSLRPNDEGNPEIVPVNTSGWTFSNSGDVYTLSNLDNNDSLQITVNTINGKSGQPEIGIIIVGTTDIAGH